MREAGSFLPVNEGIVVYHLNEVGHPRIDLAVGQDGIIHLSGSLRYRVASCCLIPAGWDNLASAGPGSSQATARAWAISRGPIGRTAVAGSVTTASLSPAKVANATSDPATPKYDRVVSVTRFHGPSDTTDHQTIPDLGRRQSFPVIRVLPISGCRTDEGPMKI